MAKNFAYSIVATAPSPATSGTSVVVQAGDGAKFPAVPFPATVWPAGLQPLTTNAEVVIVTGVSTDTLTIARAQEGSSARTVVISDQIAATVTADLMVQNNRFTPISATIQNIVLTASTDFVVPETLEIGSTFSLEIPSTSTLEVGGTGYGPQYLNPPGVIQMFGSAVIPNGWLLCDGTAVSRATYSNLWTVIGVTYGAGDGSTTFTLPDFRGRSPVGTGTGTASGATAKTLGSQPTSSTGGEETHTMTLAELVAHTHTYSFNKTVGAISAGASTGANTPDVNTGSTGSGTAFNIMHPMSVVNFIIKT